MHSYADRHTHDFFFERDYPDVKVLDQIFGRLRAEPQPREFIEKQSRIAVRCLREGAGEAVDAWRRDRGCGRQSEPRHAMTGAIRIIAQGEQKQAQIEAMIRYAQSSQCRMSSLVRHFGDIGGQPEALRDLRFLRAGKCVAQRFRRGD